ncbi:MAG: M23 family metallopeptidase, partial [Deltaproteobacteria bacterium]|nr:M23 family metallopeptidase [Deltaproteobacteria bacterium]
QEWHSHGGVDMNYHHDSGVPVGQNGINKEHPSVHSPVSGTVTDKRPEWGMIEVTDERGFRHQLWHLDKTAVEKGDRVVAGQTVGTMGGRGPSGSGEYHQHVHYTVLSPYGLQVNPEEYWKNGFYSDLASPAKNAPMTPVSHLDQHTQQKLKELSQGYTIQNGETLRREGNQIWRIKQDGSTRGYFISQ